MLSDFIEDILPDSKQQEIKKHLENCSQCEKVQKRITKSIELVKTLPIQTPEQDLKALIDQAGQQVKFYTKIPKVSVSKLWGVFAVIAIIVGLTFYHPTEIFSFLQRNPNSEFTRYYPLMQGANEIIEEHSHWLVNREPWSSSLWDEGGLSPEEFEKVFPTKQSPENQ
jgi:hypothetical protein